MKRTIYTIMAVLLLCCLLCSCGRKTPEPADPLTCAYVQSGPNGGMVTTEAGTYYHYTEYTAPYSELIYFLPNTGEPAIPLCSKPNCGHSDRSCNAWANILGLGCYNGRLYFTDMDPRNTGLMVMSMELDGSDRRVMAPMPSIRRPDGTEIGASVLMFHNNKMILIYDRDESLPFEDQIVQIWVVDLDTWEAVRLFEDFITPSARPYLLIRPVDDWIYDECEFRSPDGSTEVWRIRMNMQTNEVEKLYPLGDSIADDDYYVKGDQICCLDSEKGFMRYDLTTGEITYQPLPIADVDFIQQTDGLIAATKLTGEGVEDRTTWFLNEDLEIIDQIDFTDRLAISYMDEYRLYFGYAWVNQSSFQFWADRAELGKGELTLHRILEDPEPGKVIEPETRPAEIFETGPIEGVPVSWAKGITCVQTETDTWLVSWERRMLYRVPADGTEMLPACGKADCDHTGPDCDASLEDLWEGEYGGVRDMGYFRDRVILAMRRDHGRSLALFSFDPATGEKQEIMTVGIPGTVINGTMFHENTLLVKAYDESESEAMKYFVQAVDLPTGQVRDLCRSFLEGQNAQIVNFYGAVGQTVYVTAAMNDPVTRGTCFYLAGIDLRTGALETLLPTNFAHGEQTNICHAEGETLFCLTHRGGFGEYDCATGQTVPRPGAEANAVSASFLDDLIVLCCEPAWEYYFTEAWENMTEEERKTLNDQIDYYFLTRDYEKLDELHITDGSQFAFATEEAIWFADWDENYSYIPRSAIGSGALELIPVK